MKNKILKLTLVATMLAGLQSCSKSEDNTPSQIIGVDKFNVLRITYKNSVDPLDSVVLEASHTDGTRTGKATITPSATFKKNTTYNGKVTFYNNTVTPARQYTNLYLSKDKRKIHQFFYSSTAGLGDFSYTPSSVEGAESNVDDNGLPFGMFTIYKTPDKEVTGKLQFTIIHSNDKSTYPAQPIDGTFMKDQKNKDGNPYQRDIDVTFDITVK